jgi:hypothetical protein
MEKLGIEIRTFKSDKNLPFLLLLMDRLFCKCGDLIVIFCGLTTVHNGTFEGNGHEYIF